MSQKRRHIAPSIKKNHKSCPCTWRRVQCCRPCARCSNTARRPLRANANHRPKLRSPWSRGLVQSKVKNLHVAPRKRTRSCFCCLFYPQELKNSKTKKNSSNIIQIPHNRTLTRELIVSRQTAKVQTSEQKSIKTRGIEVPTLEKLWNITPKQSWRHLIWTAR